MGDDLTRMVETRPKGGAIAVIRAVKIEFGDGERAHLRVPSDTVKGRWFRVTAWAEAAGKPIVFRCEPQGRKATEDCHPVLSGEERAGIPPCKHAQTAALRLELDGLALWRESEGRWVATVRAAAMPGAVQTPPRRISPGPEGRLHDRQIERWNQRADAITEAREGPGGDPFGGFPR